MREWPDRFSTARYGSILFSVCDVGPRPGPMSQTGVPWEISVWPNHRTAWPVQRGRLVAWTWFRLTASVSASVCLQY